MRNRGLRVEPLHGAAQAKKNFSGNNLRTGVQNFPSPDSPISCHVQLLENRDETALSDPQIVGFEGLKAKRFVAMGLSKE